MTDPHAITAESLLLALPRVLQEDPVTLGLAKAIAAELEDAVSKTTLASIYTNIDNLDEPMLDILAKDFKVDWWRPNATIEEKRYALKSSWYVHRHLGTPASIRAAIADFLGSGKLEEWYEYNGQPHHFRIKDGNNTAIMENYSLFTSVLRVVQRGSSVLDSISSLLEGSLNTYVATAMTVAKTGSADCDECDLSDITIMSDENNVPLLFGDGMLILW